MGDLALSLDAFVRLIAVNKGVKHSLFLGAGASISSEMPSAQWCIWEWKRAIFLTNNVGLERQFSELSLRSTRDHIQRWLDKQGKYPQEGAPAEYAAYIEACYPVAEARKLYFQEKVRNARPHTGYELLCLLADAGVVRSVWTTNFDALVGRAAAGFSIVPIEVGIDCAERVIRPARAGELLIVSLHGDYRYDRLKNTPDDLRSQEKLLQNGLIQELANTPLIVCGYSGRDSSVMETLFSAVSTEGTGSLFWCVQGDADVLPKIKDVIQAAREHHREAFIVPTQGFDDLMARISSYCLEGDAADAAMQILARKASQPEPRRPFEIESTLRRAAVIKGNLFELECPTETLECEVKGWPQTGAWAWVRQRTLKTNLVAVPFRGKIYALGIADELKECFGPDLKGLVRRAPVSNEDLRYDNSAIASLMRVALVRAFAATSRLETDGGRELWTSTVARLLREGDLEFAVHDSVCISLRQIGGRLYLILKPSLRVLSADGTPAPREVADRIRMSILGYQHNREFNDAMNVWRSKLFGTSRENVVTLEFPPGSGSAFRFAIRRAPVFASIGKRASKAPAISVAENFRRFLKQSGLEVHEPRLLFATKRGEITATDVHPVRGIVNNRPFDFPLTQRGLKTSLRLGVICPARETALLQAHLDGYARRITPGPSEIDYLPPYPGFDAAFGVALETPSRGSSAWFTCPEPSSSMSDGSGSIQVANTISRGLETLQGSCSPHAVLIFIPERWTAFRSYSTETERFNLHDFVKAKAVQRGIGTQFLEESTLQDPLQCRVRWWLSLAFYVKAMRTPWVLEGLDPNTAFVGLGMSPNRAPEEGKQIVLGCSHIYSARGEGLQYRLSKVENPVFHGKNAFLSREDARRVGENIRELFFDSRDKLPERVVIHKRTHFTKEERIGLQEGLSGVAEIEMLEIVEGHDLRYVASRASRDGSLYEDNFPVRRGTVVKLDDYSALVWLHGSTNLDGSERRYYQGKRRIPTPLLVRRHAGRSDLGTIAEDMPGLSKMNWNTFDLYARLPATIHSSNEIARIGSLLEKFGSRSYDFRLFI